MERGSQHHLHCNSKVKYGNKSAVGKVMGLGSERLALGLFLWDLGQIIGTSDKSFDPLEP